MGFQQGLSGLNASSKSLDVIGHNIANANTTGMKSNRAEFAELVTSSLGLASGKSSGIGVGVATVSTQFTQGSITVTGVDTDVAINGGGFFQVERTDGTTAFTRAGNFKIDKDGYLLSNDKSKVSGYELDPVTGVKTSTTTAPLLLPTSKPVPAFPTSKITAEFNLDARAEIAAGVPADLTTTPPTEAILATPRSTYGTSLNVFDEEGVATAVTLYFEKDIENTWNIFSSLATDATPVGTIVFNSDGTIFSAEPASTLDTTGIAIDLNTDGTSFVSPNPNIASGFLPQTLTLKLDNVTQFGNRFSVSNLTQDGYTSGEVTGVGIGDDGKITARYSNGQTQYAGQIALANFRNVQGLSPLGGSMYAESAASGQPVPGSPGEGNFGALRSGSLEESNVDLTSELVNMMTAQRAYQANAQTIKTQDQVMSTLVNMR